MNYTFTPVYKCSICGPMLGPENATTCPNVASHPAVPEPTP